MLKTTDYLSSDDDELSERELDLESLPHQYSQIIKQIQLTNTMTKHMKRSIEKIKQKFKEVNLTLKLMKKTTLQTAQFERLNTENVYYRQQDSPLMKKHPSEKRP